MHPCTHARTHTRTRALARTHAHIRRQACAHNCTRYDSMLNHLHLSIDGRNNREKQTCRMLRPSVKTNSRLRGRCQRDHISSYMAKAVRLELVKQKRKTTFQILRSPPPPPITMLGGAALVGPGSSTAVSSIVMGGAGVRGGARFEFPIISPIYGLWIFRVRGPDHTNCKSGLLGLVGFNNSGFNLNRNSPNEVKNVEGALSLCPNQCIFIFERNYSRCASQS